MSRPEITVVSALSLEYFDVDGTMRVISFKECFENWTNSHSLVEYDDHWAFFLDRGWFCVADKCIWGGNDNQVIFYTEPKTTFHFDSYEQANNELLIPLHSFGWATYDRT
jgi:hypothetical protein